MASPVAKGVGPRPGPGVEIARIRKDLARHRREPLRILIASDPQRPVRAIVVPRLVPTLAALAVVALALVAGGLMFTSVRLGASADSLRGRLASMVAAAETVPRHPLPAPSLPPGALPGSGAVPDDQLNLRAPAGDKGRFRVESVNTSEEVEVVIDLASGEPEAQSYRRLRHLLRCRRTGAETPADPRLVELLY